MNFKTDQRKYRVYLENGANANQSDAWRYYELRGKFGNIYPYSEKEIGVQVNSQVYANRLKRMGAWKVIQDADDFVVFVARNDEYSYFAEMLKCRRKRVVSERERQRLVEMGKKHGYSKARRL